MGAGINSTEAMWEELVRLCNAQFNTPPFRRLLGATFTEERAQQYSIQMAYYVQNRRDCWGYVQGSAPFEIKKLIWQHEEDELIGRKTEGKVDHMTLAIKEGEVFGLCAEAFERTARLEGGEVCFSAWIRLAQRSWLEAIAGSAILEMRNSGELIKGGSLSRRIGAIFERDLDIPMKKQINNAEHVVMDVEHAHLLMRVARQYADSDATPTSDSPRCKRKSDDRSSLSRSLGGYAGGVAVRAWAAAKECRRNH